MPDVKGPAVGLAPGMFARNAIEPTLDATGQAKVSRIDREHEPTVEDAQVKPLGQDELHALATASGIDQLFPFVEPGELLPAPVFGLADRREHDGCLQPLQRTSQQFVLA